MRKAHQQLLMTSPGLERHTAEATRNCLHEASADDCLRAAAMHPRAMLQKQVLRGYRLRQLRRDRPIPPNDFVRGASSFSSHRTLSEDESTTRAKERPAAGT